jgi:hypothetical protein
MGDEGGEREVDMKTAIYIENGDTQLVLTPEDDWEMAVIRSIETGRQDVTIKRGDFYECQGVWHRMSSDETSLILRTKTKTRDEYGISTTEDLT